MENIKLGRASIDEDVMLSSDVETEESTDTELPTSIDTAKPEAGEEIRLTLQDYLDPGRTYSNRSTIKIPGDDTKKSKFNADYYCMNQHRSDIAQIENDALSDMKNQLEEETSYSDPYPVFNIDSFTQAYDIAVKSRTGKEKFNIRQALTGNRNTKSDFYEKINMVYGKLMEKAL
ncbi:hypothetical protein DY000_02053352 [Brassica cretica]|uniref:Uncharacterized protein n=1 Tax=Brassica cretica TaxID=69181 RepID=A0ABQ7AD89_BRACR|nr:hypothetical protein DY000_02053352 [Brassica cretica]